MAKHRIGKDLLVRWRMVDQQGAPYDLSKLNIRVEMLDIFRRRINVPSFTVENTSKIVFTFAGAEQTVVGPYTLVAYINEGKEGQSVIDACAAFELVKCIHQESDQGLGGIAPEYEDLVSTIEIGTQGKSAYASWLTTGHTGTEADFVNWIREPAEKLVEEARLLIDDVSRAEAQRGSNEELRKTAEIQRNTEESLRQNAELSRATAEDSRQSSERTREQAEKVRDDAEKARVAEFTSLKEQSESATKKAASEATKANQASIAAQLAAEECKELNDHQPIIGEDGNWWVWNATANCYINSGKPSKGDICYPEFYVDSNTMELHIRKPQGLPDGMFRLEKGELILNV